MLKTLGAAEATRFREFLRSADYTENGFWGKHFLKELPSRQAGNLPWQLESTSDPSAFNLLIRLFLFGLSQPFTVVRTLFPSEFVNVLLNTGALEARGEAAQPLIMLAPLGGLIVAADPLYRMQPVEEPDIILWPNDTTRLLLNSSIQTPVGSTLDLGAGSGVISLSVSNRSEHVVATDLNPRTVEFVRFNTWLNGMTNVETLIGDTYEPVADRRFDRILANPPFFISPSSDVLYCENPLDLDGYCRRVVQEGAERLNAGGFLQMVFEWVEVEGEKWQDRLAGWLDDTGCDAWVYRTYFATPESYAHQRMNRQYAVSPEKATHEYERALAYYRRNNVQRVLGGIMALRRRTGANWFRVDEGNVQPGQPFGDLVEEIFATQDVLNGLKSDEHLLGLRPRLSPKAQLEQQFVVENRAWAVESIKLILPDALPTHLGVESAVAHFLAGCDGLRTLEELVSELAKSVKADPGLVSQQCCAAVKKLAAKRFISFPANT